jgi:hypothetical protein
MDSSFAKMSRSYLNSIGIVSGIGVKIASQAELGKG